MSQSKPKFHFHQLVSAPGIPKGSIIAIWHRTSPAPVVYAYSVKPAAPDQASERVMEEDVKPWDGVEATPDASTDSILPASEDSEHNQPEQLSLLPSDN